MKLLSLAILLTFAGTLVAQTGTWNRVGAWTPNAESTVVEFNGRMWAVGGAHVSNLIYDEIWSSADGVNWSQEVADAPFGPRSNHTCVVFNGRMWVIGGQTAIGARKNDVWSSADGVNWTQETAAAGWAPRVDHQSVVFNNRLWVIGGRSPSPSAEVWSSADGITWGLETDTPGWTARFSHACAVHNNRIWLTGGHGENTEVWNSPDGILWGQETSAPAWGGRSGHTLATWQNELWLVGGGWDFHHDAWRSTDGVNWTAATTNAAWAGRTAHASIVFNGRLWVLGGMFEMPPPFSMWDLRRDVWSTTDGANWNLENDSIAWVPREGHTSVAFGNKLWIIGGISFQAFTQGGYGNYFAEVWSSTDGAQWEHVSTAPFAPRTGHATVVFDNRLWVIGGEDGNWTCNDVWSSRDGVNWTQHAGNAPWTARHSHSACVFNGRIYIAAGSTAMGMYLKDVWSSADGANWTQEIAGAPWASRVGAGLVAFGGKMWLVGGGNFSGAARNVWSSPDGVNWTLEVDSAAWLQRTGHSVTVYNNRIWLAGGAHSGFLMGYWRDLMCSTDGVNWTQVTASAPWFDRTGQTLVGHDNRLWLIGGGTNAQADCDVWTFTPDNPPVITSNPPTAVSVGAQYSYTITASGSPTPQIAVSGLPAWLSFNGNTISGTPAATDVGMTPLITVSATNAGGQDTQQFQVNVVSGPLITSSPMTVTPANAPWSYQVVAQGIPAPVLSVIGLPAWMSLNGDTLSGTPGIGDIGLSGVIEITATNIHGTDMQSFQVDVQGVAPQITSAPALMVNEGGDYSYTITATGLPAPTISVTGLPAWLSFDPASNTISGTPGNADIGMTGQIIVTASNAWNPDGVQSFAIDVQPNVKSSGSSGGGGCAAGAGAANWLWLLCLLIPALIRRRANA